MVKKKFYIILILILFFSSNLYSQIVQWEKLYGPPGREISVFTNDFNDNIFAGSSVNSTIWYLPVSTLVPI